MAKQSRIAHLSDSELSAMTTKEIAEMYYDGNNGAAWNALNARGLKGAANDGERKQSAPRQKKIAGYLPGRVSDWAMKKMGRDPEEEDLPEGFCPENFLALTDVSQESVNYLRLISRLEPEKELAPFRAWLGCGLTIADREQERLDALTKGAGAKVGKALKTALINAEFNPELAIAIAALMTRFGFQTDTDE